MVEKHRPTCCNWQNHPDYKKVPNQPELTVRKATSADAAAIANFNINMAWETEALRESAARRQDPQTPGPPRSRKKDAWLTVNACRFENCRVPLSFLLITTDCLFVNCRFEDDKNPPPMEKELQVTYYTTACTDMFNKTPDPVKLIENSATKLTVPVGAFSK